MKIVRVFFFIFATFVLSKFFEAGNLIASDKTSSYIPMSLISLTGLIFSFLVMGYWIYSDEKKKNNLKVKFGIYEYFFRILNKGDIQSK